MSTDKTVAYVPVQDETGKTIAMAPVSNKDTEVIVAVDNTTKKK